MLRNSSCQSVSLSFPNWIPDTRVAVKLHVKLGQIVSRLKTSNETGAQLFARPYHEPPPPSPPPHGHKLPSTGWQGSIGCPCHFCVDHLQIFTPSFTWCIFKCPNLWDFPPKLLGDFGGEAAIYINKTYFANLLEDKCFRRHCTFQQTFLRGKTWHMVETFSASFHHERSEGCLSVTVVLHTARSAILQLKKIYCHYYIWLAHVRTAWMGTVIAFVREREREREREDRGWGTSWEAG